MLFLKGLKVVLKSFWNRNSYYHVITYLKVFLVSIPW